jgi:hypothetical protein
MPQGEIFDARLKELRLAFVESLDELSSRFDMAVERLALSADLSSSQVERARLGEIAHKLAGTGALYGYPALTAWGRWAQKLAHVGNVDELRNAALTFRELVTQALKT